MGRRAWTHAKGALHPTRAPAFHTGSPAPSRAMPARPPAVPTNLLLGALHVVALHGRGGGVLGGKVGGLGGTGGAQAQHCRQAERREGGSGGGRRRVSMECGMQHMWHTIPTALHANPIRHVGWKRLLSVRPPDPAAPPRRAALGGAHLQLPSGPAPRGGSAPPAAAAAALRSTPPSAGGRSAPGWAPARRTGGGHGWMLAHATTAKQRPAGSRAHAPRRSWRRWQSW